MPRMKILNSVEREVFDFPPIFNSVERKRCFDFPTPLLDIATSLRTASNQLVFLLSCGYFKAAKRFYPVPTFHRRDLTYVADRIAVTLEGIDLTDWPEVLLAAKTYANDPLKSALTVDFCIFEGPKLGFGKNNA